MRLLEIRKNDAGQRLDKFLTKAVKGLPQSLMYKYIRQKKIKVNRARATEGQILCEGDEVQLFIRDEFFDAASKDIAALSAITPKLDIVYEDDDLLLLNKRPGVLVHDDAEGGENTLIMHVQAYLVAQGAYDPADEQSFAPALCNRIDRNTGGMVIAAKNAEALRDMNALIREDQISKYYLCLAHGRMPQPSATLTGYLRKDSADNLVTVEDHPFPGAKEIITKYRVVDERETDGEIVSLLEIHLVTGRTHQIRAHLSYIGHPLVGDGKYGINRDDRASGFKYQALYAYRLRFDIPGDGGCLARLRGREFTIPADRIWFTEGYDLSRLADTSADYPPLRAPARPAEKPSADRRPRSGAASGGVQNTEANRTTAGRTTAGRTADARAEVRRIAADAHPAQGQAERAARTAVRRTTVADRAAVVRPAPADRAARADPAPADRTAPVSPAQKGREAAHE